MKITLQVNRREMTFSEQERSSVLEEHFSNKTTKKVMTAKVPQKPTEDEWFEVKPQAIDQKLFKNKKKDDRQEATRQLILEAFAEMKKNPDKYGKNFKTMMPKKTWSSKTVAQLKEMASNLGNHNANWIEQALEWAQRIANGESWEAICNDKDTANCYRLVIWKDGYARLIGGSVNSKLIYYPASSVLSRYYWLNYQVLDETVPLVVLYE